MSGTIIKVENLSKQYRIGGAKGGYKTIRETIVNAAKAPFQRFRSAFASGIPYQTNGTSQTNGTDYIWALKDVSFKVNQGEVVGIIGRNGAGKTTLLKILSRITEPTRGRVELRGRAGSLLEVGTGFHPELTGHENVYMYGAILGMDRWEVTRKFDEIVAFAELEKFIETPVKRYSTGMYMRLAFAVAAHMETEILLVDEVLAVGDAAFQKKCLEKMNNISKEGRTVLFVSHNMQAVQSLCQTAFQIDMGSIVNSGDSQSVVRQYISQLASIKSEKTWSEESAPGNEELKLTAIRVGDGDSHVSGIYSSKEDIYVEMEFITNTLHKSLCVGFDLMLPNGEIVARSYQTDLPPDDWPKMTLGQNRWLCSIPKGLLNASVYYISPRIGMHNMYWLVNLDFVVQFEIILDHGVSPFWNVLDGKSRPGIIAPIFKWKSRNDASK